MASNPAESPQLSEEQIQILEQNFNKVTKHPDGTTLLLIAAEAGLSEEETETGGGGGVSWQPNNQFTPFVRTNRFVHIFSEPFKRQEDKSQTDFSSMQLSLFYWTYETETWSGSAKWFKQRNAKWRQAEGLPPKLGSVLD